MIRFFSSSHILILQHTMFFVLYWTVKPFQVSLVKPVDYLLGVGFKRNVKLDKIGNKYLRRRKDLEENYRKRQKELAAAEEPKSFREPKTLDKRKQEV